MNLSRRKPLGITALGEVLGPLGIVEATFEPFGSRLSLTHRDGREITIAVPAFDSMDDLLRLVTHELDRRDKPEHKQGKALGFRSWKLDGYTLHSANTAFGGWKIDEPTEAICHVGMVAGTGPPQHQAPHPYCSCGLYALHAPEFMSRWHQDEPLMVHGAVLGWGRIEVHHEGWRAQYAQPVMLAFDGDRQPYNHCERVKAMGAELGLAVAEWPEFEAHAHALAEPVPRELRPKQPEPATRYHSGYIGGGGATMMMPAPGIYARRAPPCVSCGFIFDRARSMYCPACGH